MASRVPMPPLVGPRLVFLSAAWTASSQIAIMALGASMGIILLLRFGKSAQTDAAFAANGIYGVLLMLCIGFRISLASRLAEGPSLFANFDHFLGASMSLLVVSGLVLVGLGSSVAAIVGGSLGLEAQETIRVSLAILWIALIAQLLGALGAAVLGVRGEFGLSGVAYALGALCAVACLLLLPATMGVVALPASTAAGSLLTAIVIVTRMVRLGYVPRGATLLQGLGELRTMALLLVASIAPVATQLNYLISLGFAARLGAGVVTLYTYAFAAAGVVTGVTAGAGGLVMAGQLAQTWDRRPMSLDAYLRPMLRVGLLIVLPALALAAWLGEESIELLLGRSLSPSDAHTIVVTFLLLGGVMIATMAAQVPVLAAYALSWYGRVAVLLLITTVVHLGLSMLAYVTGVIALLGLAASVSISVALLLVVGAVYGKNAAQPLILICREASEMGIACAIAFVPLRLAAAALGDGLWDVPLAIGAIILFGLLLHTWLPEHYALAGRIARQVGGAARRGSMQSS